FTFFTALGLGQTAVDQGGVPIGSVEADPFESAHGSDLFLTERGGESRHATVDGLIGVAIGGAAALWNPMLPRATHSRWSVQAEKVVITPLSAGPAPPWPWAPWQPAQVTPGTSAPA